MSIQHWRCLVGLCLATIGATGMRKFPFPRLPQSAPMTRVRAGTYQHWRILNKTRELHRMHIQQVNFLAYAENGVPLEHPAWLETINVSTRGNPSTTVWTLPIPSAKAC